MWGGNIDFTHACVKQDFCLQAGFFLYLPCSAVDTLTGNANRANQWCNDYGTIIL